MKKSLLLVTLVCLLGQPLAYAQKTEDSAMSQPLPVSALLGETLSYNISFLWFKKIARGEISLRVGEQPGTYLATLKASTRGVAAFFTRNRVETYTTLMEEGPDGLLRPLSQVSDTRKGKGDSVRHRISTYTFDFANRQVIYHKTINGEERSRKVLQISEGQKVYDFLTAFYNLRLHRLGSIKPGKNIKLTAFSRKGPKEIVVCPVFEEEQKSLEIPQDLLLCKVLLDPEVFRTQTRDVYVGFDERLRPLRAVVKNVIGLGDVRGELTNIVEPSLLR